MTQPKFQIDSVTFFERPFALRIPFQYGVVTLRQAAQLFARVTINVSGQLQEGWAAEVMAPKWFDKSPKLTDADNAAQLRRAATITAAAYTADGAKTAFGFFARNWPAIRQRANAEGLNALVAAFGPGLIDRAIADAICRSMQMNFATAVRLNVLGIDFARIAPDLADIDSGAFLSSLAPLARVALRHTVGLADALTPADIVPEVDPHDGLPVCLQDVVSQVQPKYFKIKVRGDHHADAERLAAIATILKGSGRPFQFSLDGNEQFQTAAALTDFWALVQRDPRLDGFIEHCLFLEQPFSRQHTFDEVNAVRGLATPCIIDEADAELNAFLDAKALGYRGVSSKQCKGFYRSIMNAARARTWGNRYFLTGEDLTTQAGICVQQDLALASLLGIAHVERNGHHYVDGLNSAPQAERKAFLNQHPKLYNESGASVRLRISQGMIELSDLTKPGFARNATPQFDEASALRP